MGAESNSLPNVEAAFIPESKLRDYLLNPDHVDGTNKCRVFRSAFGVEPEDWERFRELLLAALPAGRITGTRERADCILYEVRLVIPGQDGSDKNVVSSWKVPRVGGAPSLVTAYLRT